ncbi:NAD(P)/FAD-dependent oxidoreductase [Chloroflexota bacterium]
MNLEYDVIIIGAGPAGLTAGLYTSRAKLNTLIIEKELFGGELMNRDLIENFPGFPEGVIGPELGSKMLTQAKQYGVTLALDDVLKVIINDSKIIVQCMQKQYLGRSLIICSGAHSKKLGIPGEDEYRDRGVFYCATCDGPKYENKSVTVVGGGDSGLTEALQLIKIASKVTVIESQSRCTATRMILEKALAEPNFKLLNSTKINAILGDKEVESVNITDLQSGEESILETEGVLVRIGIIPNTEYLKATIPLNENGQVIVNQRMETSIPGVFAAGDVRSESACQISSASGDGATAAISLEKWLGIR